MREQGFLVAPSGMYEEISSDDRRIIGNWVSYPETISEVPPLRLTISFSVSREVPLTTLVFGASNRLLFSIWWSGLKRHGIAPRI